MSPRALAWPALLVVALAALGLALLVRPAGAQGASARGWEYRVFRMDPADYADKADYREILRANNDDPLRAESDFHQHVLSFLGGEGWELVSVERPRPNLVHFYLKRPVR